jgi:tryptophan synthase alpha chain
VSRLEATFAALAARGQKALCAYLCMGDPSLAESVDLAVAAASGGADILELGVPFSDPTADGPVIARAALRSIANGTTLRRVIDAAAEIRAKASLAGVPLVLFTYYNPVLTVGEGETVALAKRAGIDALLVVDLPPEEGLGLRKAAAEAGLALVPLIAPTSDDARADAIVEAAKSAGGPRGFLYYVSMTGVTGAGSADFEAAREHARRLRERSGWPVLVGFGIDGPDAARAAAGRRGSGADGVVVGTAIVKRVEAGSTREARVASVKDFVADLRSGLDRG